MSKGAKIIVRTIMVVAVIATIYGFLSFPRIYNALFGRKSINVLAWPSIIDSSEFERFEQETGIKIYLTYFENYEELIVKMKSGASDYDLIMSSDYAVTSLLQENIVQPIDKKRLSFWKDMNPALLNLSFDPDNMYTIPFSWELYGIGIDRTFFKEAPPQSWRLLFDPSVAPSRVGMLDDARELISIAALYLFGKQGTSLSPAQLADIKQLLLTQKQWVASYTDLRTDYLLLSKTVPVALGISSSIFQAMKESDLIDFVLPKEGSFMLIDHFMIPAHSKKLDFVYSFLNFLYQPEVLGVYADRYLFYPVRSDLLKKNDQFLGQSPAELLPHLSFFNYQIPEPLMRSLWIALKS